MPGTQYDLESLDLPRLSGRALCLFVGLLERRATRWIARGRLMKALGVDTLRRLTVDEPPTFQPLGESSCPAPEHALIAPDELTRSLRAASEGDRARPRSSDAHTGKGFAFATVQQYAEAYSSGLTTPEDVAERVLQAMTDADTGARPLRAFVACDREDVLTQARASGARLRRGRPLSVFDGVPVAVKDEVDMVPYPTTVGTRFLGCTPAARDSTVVARLRAAGALLIGKTNMHEIGIGVTGLNAHHGAVRNPYHTGHCSGGSSSGSGAAVAAGLCPVAVGADGGGSIRIPAAFCGVVGLKPTYTRVSEFGAAPLDWSVAHIGPIGATARDVALAYAVMAGPDPNDPPTLAQPPVVLAGLEEQDLRGLTLGVYRPWLCHASSAVVETCQNLLDRLQDLGARIREVEIPELDALRVAHLVTITSEMAAAMERQYREHRRDFSLEVRADLALARCFTARDYLQAQRIRTRAMTHFRRVLGDVDAIVTPTTACTAPQIPRDAIPAGISDAAGDAEIMRFVVAANFTGLPAISIPAGYDPHGLPVGLQAIGRRWQEHVLLRLAQAAEQAIDREPPTLHYRLLP